jgi:dynamin 1-like protein
MFVNELRNRIDSYFAIALHGVKDSVPKAIGYFLVRKS